MRDRWCVGVGEYSVLQVSDGWVTKAAEDPKGGGLYPDKKSHQRICPSSATQGEREVRAALSDVSIVSEASKRVVLAS